MALGKQVGFLSIRVLPDATDFRKRLQALIKHVENSYSVNLKVHADTRDAELTIARFRKAETAKSVKLAVGANTAIARAQLAALARARRVSLHVVLDKASLARASTAIEMLSGFRVARTILGDVGNALKNIDLNVPKIARVSLAIAGLTSLVLVASAGLVTLAGDLAKIGNTGLILPAMFTGMAVGVLTLAMALKDSKTELAELAPAMHALQDSISSEFWARAKAPIIDFVQSILPQLNEGFAITASALGRQAAAVADAFKETFANGVLLNMFEKLRETMDIVTGGAQNFAETFTTLGTVGSQYLPRLAEWVVKIGDAFNTWVTVSAANGALDRYIEDGITQMKLFGASIADTVRFLKGIDSAASAAGGGGLAAFAANMKGAAAIINDPTVQSTLTKVLVGAGEGMDGLGRGMEKFGGMLKAIAPQISSVLTLAGTALGGLLGAMSDAMARPAAANGLVEMFEGIKLGIDALGPAMAPLFDFLGQLGSSIGTLAATIGPVLATMKTTFAPVLDSLLVAVTPLIPLLGDLLVGALLALQPAILAVGEFLRANTGLVQGAVLVFGALGVAIKLVSFGSLVAGWVAATAAMILSKAETVILMGMYAKDFVVAAAKVVAGLAAKSAAWVINTATIIGNKVQTLAIVALYAKDFVVAAAKTVAGLAASTGAWVLNTGALVASKAALLAGAVAMGVATAAQWAMNVAMSANPIALIVIAIAALVAGIIFFFTQTELGKEIWANFTQFLGEAWTNIQAVATTVFTELGNFFSDLWNNIVGFIQGAVAFIMDIFFNWHPLGIIIKNWDVIVKFFVDTWNNIVKFISTAIGLVLNVITTVGATVAGVWESIWTGIGDFFSGMWDGIVLYVETAIRLVRDVITSIGNTISSIWGGIWRGLGNAVSGAWGFITGIIRNIVSGISGMIGSIGSTIARIPGTIGNAFAGAGRWLLNAGRSIVQGLINGVMGMIGNARRAAENVMSAIANFFPHSPAKEGPFSGRGWTLYSGQAMGEGLADGMDSSVAAVRRSALAMMTAATVEGTSGLLGDADLGGTSESSGTGNQVNLTVNYPISEPTSETIRRGSQLVGAALV